MFSGAGCRDVCIIFLCVLYEYILSFSFHQGKSLDVHAVSLFLGGPPGLFQL